LRHNPFIVVSRLIEGIGRLDGHRVNIDGDNAGCTSIKFLDARNYDGKLLTIFTIVEIIHQHGGHFAFERLG
jgi:hypothetical protein